MEDKTKEIQAMFPGAVGLALMIPKLLKLLAALFRDSRVPKYLKFLTAGAIAYVGLPLDFLPDFVPTAGKIDDLIVILLLLAQYMKACPPDVFGEHWNDIMGEDYDMREEIRRTMDDLEPLVGERFHQIRDVVLNAAGKLSFGNAAPKRQTLPEDSEE